MSYDEDENNYWEPDKIIDALAEEKSAFELSDPALAEKILKENSAMCAQGIVRIAIHSPNEKMRFDAQRYVLDRVLGRITEKGLNTAKNTFEEIMEHVQVGDYEA